MNFDINSCKKKNSEGPRRALQKVSTLSNMNSHKNGHEHNPSKKLVNSGVP